MAIPASNIVEITPRVLSGTGTDLTFNGLFITRSGILPAGTLQPFYNAQEVGDFFGTDTEEYTAAQTYFNGFDGSDTKPSIMYLYRQSTAAAPAFVRSGEFEGTQAQVLSAIAQLSSADFTATVNGNTNTITGLDFSGVSSLSGAAAILQQGIRSAAVLDVAASNTYATAVQPGSAGNELAIQIEEGTPEQTSPAVAASSAIGTAKTAGAAGNGISVEVTGTTEEVSPAVAATCKYGTAKTAGAAANAYSVVITANGTTPENFDVAIQGTDFTQENVTAGSTTAALNENDYITWASDVALTVETVQLSGGADAVSKMLYTVETKNGAETVDTQEDLETPASLTDNDLVIFNKDGSFTEETYTFTGGADAVMSPTVNVLTLQSNAPVDTQEGLLSASELEDNAYVTFSKSGQLVPGIYPLEGGQDNSAAWTGATVEYASNLNAFTVTLGTSGASTSIVNCSGSAAEAFYLTDAQNAVYSEGTDAQSLTDTMTEALKRGQNYVTLTTVFTATDDEILELAQWSNQQYSSGTQFLYVFSSQDPALLRTGQENVAAQLQELNVNGTCGIYGDLRYAAFIMGAVASINWDGMNSTITMAFKAQAGLAASVDSEADAQALESYGMNFIGNYASRNDEFVFCYPGCMFGEWKWIDSFIGSVWLANALQVQIMAGLQSAKRVPYNSSGYAFIRAWCSDVFERALTNGVISTGVSISETQRTQLQQDAGRDISQELYANGYYLRIEDATAQVRQGRRSPTLGVWYTDAGSVHRISMPVTTVQ